MTDLYCDQGRPILIVLQERRCLVTTARSKFPPHIERQITFFITSNYNYIWHKEGYKSKSLANLVTESTNTKATASSSRGPAAPYFEHSIFQDVFNARCNLSGFISGPLLSDIYLSADDSTRQFINFQHVLSQSVCVLRGARRLGWASEPPPSVTPA